MGAHLIEALTAFGNWVISSIQLVIPIFYTAESGLTLFGWLGMGGLAVGLFMMFIGVLQNFLRFGR